VKRSVLRIHRLSGGEYYLIGHDWECVVMCKGERQRVVEKKGECLHNEELISQK
jgi:hypothetical protein